MGEVNVDLENLDLSRETHLWREVTPPEKIKEEVQSILIYSTNLMPLCMINKDVKAGHESCHQYWIKKSIVDTNWQKNRFFAKV